MGETVSTSERISPPRTTGVLVMLLGLRVGAVVSTFIVTVFAWTTALFSLVPYAILSLGLVKRTTKVDYFVNVVRALAFVATPSLIVLVFLTAAGGATGLVPIYLVAGIFVLYGGAGIGAFFVTELLVRERTQSNRSG